MNGTGERLLFRVSWLPTLRRLCAVFVGGAMLVLALPGCRGADMRSDRELCMNVEWFSPAKSCGSPEDALRVNRLSFECSAANPNCRIENAQGPRVVTSETGRVGCCYTYTTVYVDDGSYVN